MAKQIDLCEFLNSKLLNNKQRGKIMSVKSIQILNDLLSDKANDIETKQSEALELENRASTLRFEVQQLNREYDKLETVLKSLEKKESEESRSKTPKKRGRKPKSDKELQSSTKDQNENKEGKVA